MAAAGQGNHERAFMLNGAAEAKMREVGMDASGFEFWTEYKRRYLDAAREAFRRRADGGPRGGRDV
jgi:hypothetical protein